jgi:hypothetical protein
MLCPFHADSSHPSAKLYADADSEHLFCFAEHRSYGTYDALTLLLGQDAKVIFRRVWDRLSEERRSVLLSDFGSPKAVLPEEWLKYSSKLRKAFQEGTIDYSRLVQGVVSLLGSRGK